MFTGIITHLAKVKKKTPTSLTVQAPSGILKRLKKGSSISVNGICLTVVKKNNTSFEINYTPETAKKTHINKLAVKDTLNLELPAPLTTILDGHIVQGHIDGQGKILSIIEKGNSHLLKFSIPKNIASYLVSKGSVAVNGISLTVIKAGKDFFTVSIIPHTWQKTAISKAKEGDYVNIEIDVIAKYLKKMI